MDNHQRRNLTFLTIGLIFILSGIEYGKFIMTVLWTWKQIMISLEQNLPDILAASSRLSGYSIWCNLKYISQWVNKACHLHVSFSLYPSLLGISQPSSCLRYGGISRFWRPLRTSWVLVCLPSVSAGCLQARCSGSGRTGAKLQRLSFFSPICLRLLVSSLTTRQVTWHRGSEFRSSRHHCKFNSYSYLGFFNNSHSLFII